MNPLSEIMRLTRSGSAALFCSVSGGKDSQAMAKMLHTVGIPIEGFIHADLGRIEWAESLGICRQLENDYKRRLHVVKRTDGKGLTERWADRMDALAGTGKPFWSSSAARYCTSDLKRDPIDKFLRNYGHNFTISAEGLRAEESTARAMKAPLEIRHRVTHSYYDGMTVEQALENYHPNKRLSLTWYPILNWDISDVWASYGMTTTHLQKARAEYRLTGIVADWWPFHPAYVYGNDRVSCVFCVLGSINDLKVGARHRPELLDELIAMEEKSGSTFKNNFSLKQLKP